MTATLFALWRTALSGWLQSLLALSVLWYGARLLRRHAGWGGAAECSALHWNGSGWLWQSADERRPVRLLRATIWPGFLLLNFRCERSGRPRSVLLLPDSATPDTLRRLRVYLRHLPVFFEAGEAG